MEDISNADSRWQKIKSIFRECMSLSEQARTKRLTQLKNQDPELHSEISALLNQAHGTSDKMQSAIDGIAVALNRQATEATEQIGHYRVLRHIGEGGMGSVYLCERNDDQFKKQVAVKILGQSRPSQNLIQRFRAERQILANLQHPYIAQLLDGGETEDGLPFIAMEYVNGTPILRYCDEHKLSIRERLRLFTKVCDAIQHAHQNFVIHRDIKSGNILIDQDGDPKLVDFGIAKLLETDDLNFTLAETMADARLLTPANASPEQVLGQKITTATDVYALGLLLYELLTGQPAYEFKDINRRVLEQVICEIDPSPPSKNLAQSSQDTFEDRDSTRDRLERTLNGDLDTIVLKALNKQPERRYPTVLELADDVNRHLVNLPVLARPDSLAYRAGKFFRRHRSSLTAATVVTAIVVGVVAYYTKQLAEERDRADLRATESERTTDFLTSILNGANKIEHTEKMTVDELLDFASQRIEPELEGLPDVQSRLHFVIGDAYGSLDELDKSLTHFEKSLSYLREATPTYERQVRYARVALDTSIYYRNRGDYEKSEALSLEVLQLHEQLFEPNDFRISYGLNKHGQILNAKGQYQQAKEFLEKAVQVGLDGVGENNEFTADAMNNLAIVYRNLGDMEGSERYYRQALASNRQVLNTRHPNLANSVANLAGTLIQRERYAEARELHEEALAMRRAIYEDRPHGQVALSAEGLGVALRGLGDFKRSTALLEEAHQMTREALGPQHPMVARRLRHLGHQHLALAQPQQALQHYQESLRLLRDLHGDSHRYVYYAKRNVADALMQLDRVNEAGPLLIEGYNGLRQDRDDLNIDMEPLQTPLGWYYLKTGNTTQAKSYFEKAVANCENTHGPSHPCSTRGLLGLAALAASEDKHAEQLRLLEQVVTLRRGFLPPNNWQTAVAELEYCLALLDQNRRERLSTACPTTRNILVQTFGVHDPRAKQAIAAGI